VERGLDIPQSNRYLPPTDNPCEDIAHEKER